jgi:hypothetical protein
MTNKTIKQEVENGKLPKSTGWFCVITDLAVFITDSRHFITDSMGFITDSRHVITDLNEFITV